VSDPRVRAEAEPSRFKFVRPVRVMFRDLDGMRHVNHAVYLSYVEAARSEYWQRVTGIARLEDFDFVLAELTARYHAPAGLHDELLVGCRVIELRRSSFLMEHEIRHAHDGRLIFDMTSVQVMYDYEAGTPIPISDLRRRQIQDFEGRELTASR
jgi:acyl-CoA thioester hydrolase